MTELTADELRRVLDYDLASGVFRWRECRGTRAAKGATAGSLMTIGYIEIRIFKRLYLAHRLAWLWVTGEWPNEQVDHINNVRNDNSWANLRAASNAQNNANTPRRKSNSTGFKGVYFSKSARKYAASITVNYKSYHLGLYATPQEAHAAYILAAKEHFGDFAHDGNVP